MMFLPYILAFTGKFLHHRERFVCGPSHSVLKELAEESADETAFRKKTRLDQEAGRTWIST